MLAVTRALRTAAFFAALCVPTVCLAQGTATTPVTGRQAVEPVETMGVGISGGIIAGAEVSLLVESFIDVKPVWPWIVVPIVTAAGGGVGGYYLDEYAPEGAIAVLVTSMALLIPTAIAISVARAYEPEEGVKLIDESGEDKYSFEEEPTPEPAAGEEPETVTEVESRPDEIPPDAAQPPAGDVEGPAAPPAEPAPAPEPSPEPSGGAAAHLAPHASRPAWARHLSSGSLLHVDGDLGAGVGVPSFDVRPVYLADEASLAAPRSGIEFRLSLLKVDLP
jgi:hypothetical protein